MQIKATWRGGAVAAGWAALLGAVILTAFFGLNAFILIGWTALCFLVVMPSVQSMRVCVDKHRLTVRAGRIFFFKQHIPLRFITGCTVLRTPLGRLSRTGVLILSFSGGVCIVFGLSLRDAAALARLFALEEPS